MKNYRSKAPMPLFYLQIENGAEAHKIYDFTELFGTRIEETWLEPGIDPRSQTIVYSKTIGLNSPIPREIAKDIKSHSQAQWKKHIEALSPEDNTLWRNSLSYASLFVPFPLERALGSTAITPIEKAEVIADSLQEQFEPNHVADREVFDQRIHEEVANFLATPHVQEIEPTTPTEVLTYVQRIKLKIPGLDQISNRVRVDRILSSPRPIRSGLPQGSLSSPLLFTLYVNDIPQTDSSHLAMFADDTAVISQNKRFSVVISNLQHYVSSLELWLNDWKIKVNASKSARLMFTRRSRLPVGLTP
ncbi:RNA-directed DNA polymerase from mobile element jockey [Trichonephila clavipes]|nr:RNA-directed DNA polymerase from mobile element jockey [Trichonephila clavipes]